MVAQENWCEASGQARDAVNASRLGQAEERFGHAEELLRRDVRVAFHGWPHLHVRLLPRTSRTNDAGEAVSMKLARSSF